MSDQKLLFYIQSEVRIGKTQQEITTALLQSGWKEKAVQDAFNEFSTAPKEISNKMITEKTYPIENKWIIESVWGSILLLLILSPFILVEILTKRFSAYITIYAILVPTHLIIIFLQRANFRYSIEDKFLTLHQGILSKQQRNIPYGVIQNVFIKQSLLDRIFGLASLMIENASQNGTNQGITTTKVFGITIGSNRRQQAEAVGFSGNKVSIPGLSKQNAETLKTIILQKMKENPVEETSGL